MARIATTGTRIKPRFLNGSTLFNGSSAYINVPHNANQLLTSGLTISAWVKARSYGGTSVGRIVDKSSSSAVANGFALYTDSNPGCFSFSVNGGTTVKSATSSVAFGKWQFVTVTATAAGAVTHYVNGSVSGTPASTNALSGITTTNDLRIGDRSASTDRYFDGGIAEVKIFNSVLTASQAAELYSTGSVSGVSPVYSDPLDEQPSTYTDTIGGVVGTGTATTYSSDTPIQQRMAVVDDKASAIGASQSAVASIDTITSNAGTMMGFAYTTTYNGDTICSFYAADGSTDSWRFNVESSTGYPFLFTWSTAPSGAVNPKPSIPVPKNQWYHFALTQTISGGVVTGKIYINGKLIGKGTRTSDVRSCSRFTITSTTTTKTRNVLAYEREVTQQEIKDHCFNRIVPTSPKIKWDRQEGAGNTNYDSSGNGYDGTGSTLTWSSDTPSKSRTVVRDSGKSLQFNKDNKASLAVFPITPSTTSFSIGGWVVVNSGMANGGMIFNWESAQERNGFFIKADTTTYKFVAVISGAAGNEAIITPTHQWKYGEWNHVVLTYTANSAKLYINGLLQGTDTSVTMTTNVNSLTLGRDAYGATRYGRFLIDDFVFQNNTIWSLSDIQNLLYGIWPTGATVYYFDDVATDKDGANTATFTLTDYSTVVRTKTRTTV